MVWVVKVVDDRGVQHELQGRLMRVVNAVIAHGEAINLAERGNSRVSWSDGDIRFVLETHFGTEPEPDRKP